MLQYSLLGLLVQRGTRGDAQQALGVVPEPAVFSLRYLRYLYWWLLR